MKLYKNRHEKKTILKTYNLSLLFENKIVFLKNTRKKPKIS